MISARGLTRAFGGRTVVQDVDLTTVAGGVTGILGPNGGGKTTLLRMLHGALSPTSGTVELDGRPLARMRAREIARRIAVVVQEPGAQPLMTAAEMVLLGRLPHDGLLGRRARADERIALEALEQVGAAHLADRPLGELSGGERQRVLIARGAAQQADHLLLDEPTNHLDVRYQHETLQLVRGLGTTAVVVLHDLNLAAQYCDQLLLMDSGRVRASGTPDHVLDPALLEQVYGIGVRRVEADGRPHLIFSPR